MYLLCTFKIRIRHNASFNVEHIDVSKFTKENNLCVTIALVHK